MKPKKLWEGMGRHEVSCKISLIETEIEFIKIWWQLGWKVPNMLLLKIEGEGDESWTSHNDDQRVGIRQKGDFDWSNH